MKSLLFIFFPICVFGQNDTINQMDENGKKRGHWIIYGKDEPHKGYPAEGKISEGTYKDDRKEGVWIRYHKDGKSIKLKSRYHNNRPSGEYAKYYPSGQLREHAFFFKNKYKGDYFKYHENGNLQLSRTFDDNGHEIDTSTYFFPNGCMELQQIHLPNGKKYIRYSQDSCNSPVKKSFIKHAGHINDELKYKRRESHPMIKEYPKESFREVDSYIESYKDSELCMRSPSDEQKVYNHRGDIIWDGACKAGKAWSGKMYFYDKDDILIYIEIWQDGKYDYTTTF